MMKRILDILLAVLFIAIIGVLALAWREGEYTRIGTPLHVQDRDESLVISQHATSSVAGNDLVGAASSPVSASTSTPAKAVAPTLKPAASPHATLPPPRVATEGRVTPVEETPGALMVVATATPSSPQSVPLLQNTKEGALTPSGILMIVNKERSAAGLPALTLARTLAVIAEVKTADMITKQYFAHEAPDGTDVGVLAERYSYEYLRVGENLAMGDFTSDADVMNGWMNSPGHRANILNPQYTEIGIAALQGMHDGRLMWYAVQEFGRPASLCPKPDSLLSQKIMIFEGQLATLEKTLSGLRVEVESVRADPDLYNAKAKDYNALVELYNTLITTTKTAVDDYNAQVVAFNACIGA